MQRIFGFKISIFEIPAVFRRVRSIIFIEHNNKAENHNSQGEVTTDEQNRQKEQSDNNQIIKYKHIKCVVQMEKVSEFQWLYFEWRICLQQRWIELILICLL